MVDGGLSVRECYLSAGCEARSRVLASSRLQNLIVYASDAELVVSTVDKQGARAVHCSARVHAQPVSCVTRIRCASEAAEFFVSGSCDGRVALWRLSGSGEEAQLEIVVEIADFSSTVVDVAGWLEEGVVVLVAACLGTLLAWRVQIDENGKGILLETCRVLEGDGPRSFFILSLDIQRIAEEIQPGGYVVFAAGTSKRTIEVFGGPCFSGKKKGEDNLNLSELRSVLDAHEDWVHSLAFDGESRRPLLASASQDGLVKLWRFEIKGEEEDNEMELHVTRNDFILPASECRMAVSVEAVLSGHEDWVHSVVWEEKERAAGHPLHSRRLITASSDKAVVLWTMMDSGVWVDSVRLGIIGGQAAGFYSAVMTCDSATVVAASYYGGLHAWSENESSWLARPFTGGHCGVVADAAWSPGGAFLLSASADKTMRVHARKKDSSTRPSFIELGRAQVHGHELQCVTVLPGGRFVSGAEEKILRVFRIPQSAAKSLAAISGEWTLPAERLSADVVISLPWGAAVPALGLSNQAVEESATGSKAASVAEVGAEADWEEASFISKPQVLLSAPTEEVLQQSTLWPEEQKLYGHGFELYSVEANPRGTLLVSACRASQSSHAALLLWQAPLFSQAPIPIPGHSLTVTQCSFSPDGRFLLSASRDRTVCVYQEQSGNLDGLDWSLLWQSASKGGPHSRIIWSAAWLAHSTHFVTASRDSKVILWCWKEEERIASPVSSFTASHSVTAFAAGLLGSGGDGDVIRNSVIVAGYENGRVEALEIRDERSEGKSSLSLSPSLTLIPGSQLSTESHAILRLRFCPRRECEPLLLAIASANKKLRIFELKEKVV